MPETLSPQPTPDNFLKSRTLSDAELLKGGADYENGILKPTYEQLEVLRNRPETARLGHLGLEMAGVMLHKDSLSDLTYLSGEHAVDNYAELRAEVTDILSRYEDATKMYFPQETQRFEEGASRFWRTQQNEDGQSINYNLEFRSAKVKDSEGRKTVIPQYLYVKSDKYGNANSHRDTARFDTKADGTFSRIVLKTSPIAHETIPRVSRVEALTDGRFDKGIATEIITMIDGEALPSTQIYENNQRVDDSYEAEINLTNDRYILELRRKVKEVLADGRLTHDEKTEKLTYTFDPETNLFVKSSASSWDAGPEQITKATFVNVVNRALGNIPTFNI